MSVGTKNAGKRTSFTHRPIQIARHKEAGQTLERNILNGVPFVSALAVNDGIRRTPVGHGRQFRSTKDTFTNPFGALLPLLEIGIAPGKPCKLLFCRLLTMIVPPTKLNLLLIGILHNNIAPLAAREHTYSDYHPNTH